MQDGDQVAGVRLGPAALHVPRAATRSPSSTAATGWRTPRRASMPCCSQGRLGGRPVARSSGGSGRMKASQQPSDTRPARANTTSVARHPPNASASGIAAAAAMSEPATIPAAYAPVARAGSAEARSLTTIGSTAPAVPMPTPIATVVSRIAATPGRAGRSRPNATIPSMHSAMALRGPIRPLTHGPIGANRPMSSTGIVVSSPTTPNETPRSAWIWAAADRCRRAAGASPASRGTGRRAQQGSPGGTCPSGRDRRAWAKATASGPRRHRHPSSRSSRRSWSLPTTPVRWRSGARQETGGTRSDPAATGNRKETPDVHHRDAQLPGRRHRRPPTLLFLVLVLTALGVIAHAAFI